MSVRPSRPFRSATVALGAAASLVALTACGSGDSTSGGSGSSNAAAKSEAVQLTDAQNRKVSVPKNPKKVVVLDWSAARSLHGLGVKMVGLPKPSGELPQDLKDASSGVKQVGSLFEPDYEGIAELEPDLIVVGARSGNAKVVKELTKITPNVVDVSARTKKAPEQLNVMKTRYTQLASIFGKDAEAKNELGTMDKNVATLKAKASKDTGKTMFVSVSGSKVSAYGPGSRFDRVWSNFGFTPSDGKLDNKGSHGEEINQEFFVKYNPSRVLVLDRGRAVGDAGKPALDVLNNGLVNRTTAAKNKKIATLDGFSWYLAPDSPISVNQMVTDASKAV